MAGREWRQKEMSQLAYICQSIIIAREQQALFTAQVQRLVISDRFDPVKRLEDLIGCGDERSPQRLLPFSRVHGFLARALRFFFLFVSVFRPPRFGLGETDDSAHLGGRLSRVDGTLQTPASTSIRVERQISRRRV